MWKLHLCQCYLSCICILMHMVLFSTWARKGYYLQCFYFPLWHKQELVTHLFRYHMTVAMISTNCTIIPGHVMLHVEKHEMPATGQAILPCAPIWMIKQVNTHYPKYTESVYTKRWAAIAREVNWMKLKYGILRIYHVHTHTHVYCIFNNLLH